VQHGILSRDISESVGTPAGSKEAAAKRKPDRANHQANDGSDANKGESMTRRVPVANTRRWADKLKELNMTHEYHEIPGGDHGSVIATGMPDIFAFFAKHTKSASR
jgi:hypothetical protein